MKQYRREAPRLTELQAKWIRNAFESADRKNRGFISTAALPKLLAATNTFKALDVTPPADARLSLADVQNLLVGLMTTPATPIRALFDQYAPSGAMSVDEWLTFMRIEQRQEGAEAEAAARDAFARTVQRTKPPLLSTELPDDGESTLSPIQFHALMVSNFNRARVLHVTQPDTAELSHPMTHYWVAASHNSYLLDEDQLIGRSSADMYRRILLGGCRSVEIDCHDGPNGEPIVTHGKTLCGTVPFADCARAIADTAFKTSAYPVSISLRCTARSSSR